MGFGQKILFSILAVVVLCSAVFAQSNYPAEQVVPTIESYGPTEVLQGQTANVTIKGVGLSRYKDVLIDPADGMTITVKDVRDDRIRFSISMSCDAEVGKRRLTVGDLTTDSRDVPLYFFGQTGTCKEDAAAAIEAKPGIDGIYPAGGVEVGGSQGGYFTGQGLLQVKDIIVVGSGLSIKIGPDRTDEKLPVTFVADVGTTLGGRGIIVVLNDGTELRTRRNTDTVLRFDVVDARPKPVPVLTSTDIKPVTTNATTIKDIAPRPLPIANKGESCAPLEFLIDGKPIPAEMTVGSQLTFTLKTGPGVKAKRIVVDAKNAGVKRILTVLLADLSTGGRDSSCTTYGRTLNLPPHFPGGRYPVTVTLIYNDKEFNDQRATVSTTLIVPGKEGGFMVDMMSDDAADALAAKDAGPIKRIERTPAFDDLNAKDLDKLGILKSDFIRAMQMKKDGNDDGAGKILGELRVIKEEKRTSKREEMNDMRDDLKKKMLDELKGNVDIDPEVDVRVYEVERDGKKIVKSKITIEVPANAGDLGSGYLLAYIPKELAQYASDLDLPEDTVIVDEDPVVKWAFQNIPQDQYREYSMTVDGDAQDFTVVAQAAADKPSVLTKLILWLTALFGG